MLELLSWPEILVTPDAMIDHRHLDRLSSAAEIHPACQHDLSLANEITGKNVFVIAIELDPVPCVVIVGLEEEVPRWIVVVVHDARLLLRVVFSAKTSVALKLDLAIRIGSSPSPAVSVFQATPASQIQSELNRTGPSLFLLLDIGKLVCRRLWRGSRRGSRRGRAAAAADPAAAAAAPAAAVDNLSFLLVLVVLVLVLDSTNFLFVLVVRVLDNTNFILALVVR